MKIFRKTLAVILLVILCGCSKEKVKESIIIEKNLEEQVIDAYQEGKKSLEKGDVLFAAKKFQELKYYFPSHNLLQNLLYCQHTLIINRITMLML